MITEKKFMNTKKRELPVKQQSESFYKAPIVVVVYQDNKVIYNIPGLNVG